MRIALLLGVVALGGAVAGAAGDAGRPGPTLEEQRVRLESLGYVTTVPVAPGDPRRPGVARHDPSRSFAGLNLFASREESAARLISMDGHEVHRWASGAKGRTYAWFREHLPSHAPPFLEGWNHVALLEDGDLLVVGSHHMLARLGWGSTVEWKLDLPAHHDATVSRDGRIYTLTDGLRTVELDGGIVAFQDDQVVVLSPDGDLLRSISLFDAFGGTSRPLLRHRLRFIPPAQRARLARLREAARAGGEERLLFRLMQEVARGEVATHGAAKNILVHGREEDLFHANSVQVLERDAPGLWRKGDLLVSVLRLDRIVVIDHVSGRVVWEWGEGVLDEQHHATLQDDGTILVFDNGRRRGFSRILRVDPRRAEIVWSYEGEPRRSFFTASRGGVQALPNGNLLIAETNRGRAFEITPGGAIVWEFFTGVLEPRGEPPRRGAIYRMTRLTGPERGGLPVPPAVPGLRSPTR